LRFRLFTDSGRVEYDILFSGKGDQARVDYKAIGSGSVTLNVGRKRKTITEWFQEEPPIVRFANGDFLIYNELCKISTTNREPFAKTRIEAWDWTGVDLTKESQTYKKFPDSIQRRVINEVLASGETLLASPARERRQIPRSACSPQRGGILGCISRLNRHGNRRESSALPIRRL
jgi:hypothetical protein